MLPQIYSANRYGYPDTNGRLFSAYMATSCIIENEINGVYTLTMEVPVGSDHWDEFQKGQAILAQIDDTGTQQVFVITNITGGISGVLTIEADHISYIYNGLLFFPFLNGGNNLGPKQAFETAWKNTMHKPAGIVTDCDISAEETGANHTTAPRSIRDYILNELVPAYGGEILWDNLNCYWRDRIGKRYGASDLYNAIYGKNIITLDINSDTTTYPTSIYPYYGQAGDTSKPLTELPYRTIILPGRGELTWNETPVDLTSRFTETPTTEQLRAEADRYLRDLFSAPEDIGATLHIAKMPGDIPISLGDDIYINARPLGLNSRLEVKKIVYNVLQERVEEIQAGSFLPSLAYTILQNKKR